MADTATLREFLLSPIGIGALVVWVALAVAGSAAIVGREAGAARTSDEDVIRRVARNSALPILSQLFVRAVDLLVAIALLRLLGPDGNGRYAIAVTLWLYVKTVSDFGLSLLATRMVAGDATVAGAVVGATTLVRWLVLAFTALPVGIFVASGTTSGSLSRESCIAIALLWLSVVPASYAEAVNSALNGLERMGVAAFLNIGVSLVRAPLAVVLAASRFGVGGVAAAALVTALLSAGLFHLAVRRALSSPLRFRLGRHELAWYMRESWPLLVNGLLISLFFRVDVFIVQGFKGDRALGLYDAAYKPINLLTIVPAYVTLAVFPALAQRADDRAALASATRTTLYALSVIAWTAVMTVTATASWMIRVLAGSDFLPDSATLLRVLIWFAPLSFINGVIQYVLVATGRQLRVLPAFGAAVLFNLALNLALVPRYGATAAAVTTVLTEVVILAALMIALRELKPDVISSKQLATLWRPTVSGLFASGVALLLRGQPLLSFAAGTSVFILLGWATNVVGANERALIRRALGRV